MKLKNGLYRDLNKIARDLGEEEEEFTIKYPFDVIQDNLLRRVKNGETPNKEDYFYVEKRRVNHQRRLKQAFKDEGMEGVEKYINKKAPN